MLDRVILVVTLLLIHLSNSDDCAFQWVNFIVCKSYLPEPDSSIKMVGRRG